MRGYIIRRLMLVIPTVFITSLIVFFMIRSIPGSIVDQIMAEAELVTASERLDIEKELGLDVPMHIQYVRWIGKIAQGDFGKSLWTKSPVIEEIASRAPVTLELGLMSIIVAQLIALPIGVLSALRQDTWIDYVARSFAILCIAVPSFWLGTMVIVYPAIWWGIMPSIRLIPFAKDPIGNLIMFLVPATVQGMAMSGMTMRMTRTMMLEVLRQDYIRTAWAKGLDERIIITRHALKNALVPVITIVGVQIPIIIGGTVVIEEIFSLPGLGRLIVEATTRRDYTMLSGVMIIFALATVLINLIVDLVYAVVDPRIRYR